MLIQCPKCRALTNAGDESPAADTELTCAKCGHVFSPRAALTHGLVNRAGAAPPRVAPRFQLNVSPEDVMNHAAQAGRPREPGAGPAPGALSGIAWALAILLLMAALLAQYAYFMRADLARHVALRPWLEALCTYARCEIPLPSAPGEISIIGRDIRRHPQVADALMVTVTLNNTAAYTQAYPVLQLSFFDMNDRLVARRRFDPVEYLPQSVAIEQGLKPNAPVQSTLDIVDPGPEAVNFEFKFL